MITASIPASWTGPTGSPKVKRGAVTAEPTAIIMSTK